jgi:SAM-dependent methyltransferase
MISQIEAMTRRLRNLLLPLVGPPRAAESVANDMPVSFRCNICSAISTVPMSRLTREEMTCHGCGSTVRMRSIVHVLSTELFGRSLMIDNFPVRKDITGIGLSDWDVYADRLAKKLSYTNTFLEQEPRLDIRNLSGTLIEPVDFLISTDVFEHVAPPVAIAFDNARRLLKQGGLLVFSVPYVNDPGSTTREHFPELHDFEIVERNGARTLRNTTIDGRQQVFTDLVFHGGGGLTLEMRLFSEHSMRTDLNRAGFRDLRFYANDELAYGIRWPIPTSLVLSARADHRATL